jgi:hypothetical protein
MSERKNAVKSQKKRANRFTRDAAVFFVLNLCILAVIFVHYVMRARFDATVTVCGSSLYTLGSALQIYAHDCGGDYPEAENWCDLLLERTKVSESEFVCTAARTKGDTNPCHYAMNPDCEPNSPAGMVLLFETKGGWNQAGGPEILSTENHEGKGCNIAFNDGTVRFVPTDRLNTLKWRVEADTQ